MLFVTVLLLVPFSVNNTSKELASTCKQLRRDFRNNLREFRDPLDHDLGEEVGEIKVSVTFNNEMY